MRLSVKNLGPIAEADVTFGDLTILVGPQATGKSIFLQTLKLVKDHRFITEFLEEKGYFWGDPANRQEFLELYFGEGTAAIWHTQVSVTADEQAFSLDDYIQPKSWQQGSFPIPLAVAYVPAQRAMALNLGWPRSFTDYALTDSYALREFSEVARYRIEQSAREHPESLINPVTNLNFQVWTTISQSIYQGGDLSTSFQSKRRQVMLDVDGLRLPYTAWSTGQREFLPLFLLLYRLLEQPQSETQIIIIEEPEMGLHPKAIQAFLLLVLELIQAGYKVVLSTHSPVVLEMAWALARLQQAGAGAREVARLFDLAETSALDALFTKATTADVKVYYFDRQADGRVYSKDISALSASAENIGEAEWGGLSSFATRATDLVTEIMAEYWSRNQQADNNDE